MIAQLLVFAVLLATVLTVLGVVSRAQRIAIVAGLIVVVMAGVLQAAIIKITVDDRTDDLVVKIDDATFKFKGESWTGFTANNILKDGAAKDDSLYFFLTDPGGANDKKGDISDYLKFILKKDQKSVGVEFLSDPLDAKGLTKYDQAEEKGDFQPIPLPASFNGTNSLDIMVASDRASGGAEPTPEPKAVVLMVLGLLFLGAFHLLGNGKVKLGRGWLRRPGRPGDAAAGSR